jgi:hypothetical protein
LFCFFFICLCRPHYWPEDHCRVLVWSWVEHQTQSPILVLKRQLTLWTFTILNWKYSMFVCSSLYRYDLIYFICYLLYDRSTQELGNGLLASSEVSA